MKRLLPWIVFLAAAALQAADDLRVGTITIVPLDVYSQAEAERGAVYGIADRLHIETRQSVIRKFLLFHEGEPFSPERLAETERTLRTLHFLKSANVTPSAPHDGVVDVTVTTQDAWSIAPETQAGSKGGNSTFGASLSDTNLLGLGKEVSMSWDKNIDRTRYGIDYQDPAINSSFWNAHVAYAVTSDGHDRQLTLRRPFYSFATPWSAELSYRDRRQDDKLYAGGYEAERFSQSRHEAVLGFGRAFDPNDELANRLVAGFRLALDSFGPPRNEPRQSLLPDAQRIGVTPPVTRDYRYLFVRFEHAHNDFMKLNFVNKDLRYEDFNLGQQYTLEGALSPRFLDADGNTFFVRACLTDGVRLGEASFIVPSVTAESRFDKGPRNSILSSTVNFAHRYDGDHPSATVARLAISSGWRMDAEQQFFADGLTGLRGYRAHAIEGSRAIVANLEHRLYLGRELVQLISPGVVVFADAGNATNGGLASLMRLKTDVGIGLRIGLPRTPKNLLRIDFAYALNADSRGRRGLMVSLSSGQAF